MISSTENLKPKIGCATLATGSSSANTSSISTRRSTHSLKLLEQYIANGALEYHRSADDTRHHLSY
ncbi:MAG: hypothetical protein KGI80_02560 [Verrucomicrobiota bacterium]|nr:hypothetical protein [Verrucomicrobiota bacterium]